MIRYRPATSADVPVLRQLLQALSDHDGGPDVASEASLTQAGFGPRPLFRAILAEDEDQTFGMILYFPEFSTLRGQPGLYVQDLYVTGAARGLGVGTGLLAAAMRQQDWGAEYLTLGVDPANAPARRYYANRGFRPRKYEFLILDGTGLEAILR